MQNPAQQPLLHPLPLSCRSPPSSSPPPPLVAPASPPLSPPHQTPPPPPPPSLPTKSPNGESKLVAPSPIFLTSHQQQQSSLLSLIADRQSDLWAAAASANLKNLPAPPPLFPFGSHASSQQQQGHASSSPPLPALQTSPSLPSLGMSPSWDTLQETTARLLFMAVRWVKCLAPFQTLSSRDQVRFLDSVFSAAPTNTTTQRCC
jgi:nuclear receptor subfamily 2 group A